MPCCCAVGCHNRAEKGYKLYKFPQGEKNIERRKLWVRNLGRADPIPNHAYVCQEHFTADQFENKRADNKRLLKWNAVPTVFSHRKQVTPRKPPAQRIMVLPTDSKTIDKVECDEQSDEMQCDEDASASNDEVDELKRKLKVAQREIRKLKDQILLLQTNLKNIFNEDQIHYLTSNSMQGRTWSDSTIHKSLKLYLACGTKGYEELRRQGLPFPCIRVLQKRIEHLQFRHGVLDDIFKLLEPKVAVLKPEEKHASLLIDEMSIKGQLEYDSSINEVIGRPTMCLSGGKQADAEIATHALVFMLCGVTTRWKQVVSYEFTGNSYDTNEINNKIQEIIQKCQNIGITVRAVVSDMGPQNCSLWRKLNIVATRFGKINNSIAHPCLASKLFIMPDPPHVLKNLRNALLENHKYFIVSESIVSKYNLPCNKVSIEPIRLLNEADSENDLKLAPHLNEKVLKINQYEKMRVGPAVSLFNHDVAAGIQYLIMKKELDPKFYTTAWFVGIVHKWFTLVTSRNPKVALSENNEEVYHSTKTFLSDFMDIVRNMYVGESGAWKPFQSGMLLCTQSVCDIQETLLHTEHFRYVLMGNFTQDALENLFSCVRSRSPTPGPREFKSILRLICLSQYECKPQHGSYMISECDYLVKFCNERLVENENTELDLWCQCTADILYLEEINLNSNEQQSLYYLIGCVVFKIKCKNTVCSECLSDVLTESSDPEIQGLCELATLKSYKDGSLLYTNVKTFLAFCTVENTFRECEEHLVSNKIKLKDIEEKFVDLLDISKCHDLWKKLLRLFLRTRMYFLMKKNREAITTKGTFSSRSMAMRDAVQRKK